MLFAGPVYSSESIVSFQYRDPVLVVCVRIAAMARLFGVMFGFFCTLAIFSYGVGYFFYGIVSYQRSYLFFYDGMLEY